MITNFKILENNIGKKEIGNYVKLTKGSGFANDAIVMNNIYVIEDKYKDYTEIDSGVIFLKLSSIFNGIKLHSVPPYCTIIVTEQEIDDMKLKLATKKYNI